jgi:hypothetical protein
VTATPEPQGPTTLQAWLDSEPPYRLDFTPAERAHWSNTLMRQWLDRGPEVVRRAIEAEARAAAPPDIDAPLIDPRSRLDPISLLRDLVSPEWHDCTCDVHEAARYYLAWLDRRLASPDATRREPGE